MQRLPFGNFGGVALALLMPVLAATPSRLNAAGVQSPAPPVARVVHLNGKVTLARAKAAPRAALPTDQLRPGDKLTVAAPSGEMTVHLYGNGQRFLLRAGAIAQVTGSGLRPVAGPAPVKLAPLPSQLSLSRLSSKVTNPFDSTRGALVSRSTGDEDDLPVPQPLSPLGGVRNTGGAAPIVLAWRLVSPRTTLAEEDQPTSLRVRVLDAATRTLLYEKTDLRVTTQKLTLPANMPPPGVRAYWLVGIRYGSPETGVWRNAPATPLHVLSDAEQERAATLDALKEKGDAATDGDTLLLLGEAYELLDLYDEARTAYLAAQKKRPDAGAEAALARLATLAPEAPKPVTP